MPRSGVFSRAQQLSQFFTCDSTARWCTDILLNLLNTQRKRMNSLVFIEPSAGDGAFVGCFPSESRQIAIEVDPDLVARHDGYILADLENDGFLGMTRADLGLLKTPTSHVVVLGNPPFSRPQSRGRSNIISLDFLNHACTMADTVAMVLGCTFRRPLTINKINPNFHCIVDVDLPDDRHKHFTLEGKPAHVKCIFQIWQRSSSTRPKIESARRSWQGPFEFVKTTDPRANIRIRQWGSADRLGDITGPAETRARVLDNVERAAEGVAQGKLLDRSWYYLYSPTPDAVINHFRARRHLFRELGRDRAMGNNPDLTLDDIIVIYQTPADRHYVSGKFI